MIDTNESPLGDLEFIGFQCPHCHIAIDFLLSLGGTAQGCPNCGQSLIVPKRQGEPAAKLPIPMEGRSVSLRRLDAEDWEDLLQYWDGWNDLQICEWLKTQSSDRLTAEGKTIHLAIERKEPRAIVGNFTLQLTDVAHLQASFNVHANEALINDSLFKEACLALFVLCFGAINLHRLVIQLPAECVKQCQLLEAIGMRKEGHFRKDRWEGEWRDTVLYAYLGEEYDRKLVATA